MWRGRLPAIDPEPGDISRPGAAVPFGAVNGVGAPVRGTGLLPTHPGQAFVPLAATNGGHRSC
jgi:hypothetical protein